MVLRRALAFSRQTAAFRSCLRTAATSSSQNTERASNIHPIHGSRGPPSLRTRIAILAASTAVTAVTLAVAVRVAYSDSAVDAQITQQQVDAAHCLREQMETARQHPGVIIWGSNSSGLVRPGFSDINVLEPVQLLAFAGHALRDLVLTNKHAAAIDERGDLIQWGLLNSGRSSKKTLTEPVAPQVTAKGHDLVRLASDESTVFGLTRSGSLLKIKRESEDANTKTTAIPLPSDAKSGEKITSIACGSNHLVAVTNQGSIYTLQTGSAPNGQLDHLGLGRQPASPILSGVFYRVSGLSHIKCDKVAAGRSHTIVGAADGRVFAFGSNQLGQLGTGPTGDFRSSEPVEVTGIWSDGVNVRPTTGTPPPGSACTQIAAAGDITLFVVDTPTATRVFSCGNGQQGQLGNASFLQAQYDPVKINSISDLSEYNEKTGTLVPIRVNKIASSGTHCGAVLDSSNTAESASKTQTSWFSLGSLSSLFGYSQADNKQIYGRDILMWGQNSSGQLLRVDGKRGNASIPGFSRALTLDSNTAISNTIEKTMQKSDGEVESLGDARAGDHMNMRLQLLPPTLVTSKNGQRIAQQDVALGPGVTALFTRLV